MLDIKIGDKVQVKQETIIVAEIKEVRDLTSAEKKLFPNSTVMFVGTHETDLDGMLSAPILTKIAFTNTQIVQ